MAEERDTPAPRRLGLRLAVGVASTVAILWLLLREADPARIVEVVGAAEARGIAVGGALYAALVLIRALRYRLLAPRTSYGTLLAVHAAHALLLRVMPLRTGELAFAWLMRRAGAGTFTSHLVGLLMIRLLDLASVAAIFALGLGVFGTERLTGAVQLAPALVLGAVALLAPLYLRFALRLGGRAAIGLARRLRLDRFARVASAIEAIEGALEWAESLPRRALWLAAGLTALQWAVNFVLFGVLLDAMHVDVTVGQTVLGGTGSVLGGLLPLAGIGNFGPLEAGWSLGFAAVGMEPELAVSTAFGFSVFSFGYSVATGILGASALVRLSREPAAG